MPNPEPPNPERAPGMIVRPAVPAELDVVLPVCVEAFADEAVSAWVEPDPGLRRERTRELFSTSLRAAVDAGQLLVARVDGVPVAGSLWIGLDGAPPAAVTGPVDAAVPLVAAERLRTVLAATSARHPDVPHVYLSAMAALPRRRGLGAGSAMLRHGLGLARQRGLPVYLEASTPDNQRLYARHGFRELGAPIRLPDAGPSLQPMWYGVEDTAR